MHTHTCKLTTMRHKTFNRRCNKYNVKAYTSMYVMQRRETHFLPKLQQKYTKKNQKKTKTKISPHADTHATSAASVRSIAFACDKHNTTIKYSCVSKNAKVGHNSSARGRWCGESEGSNAKFCSFCTVCDILNIYMCSLINILYVIFADGRCGVASHRLCTKFTMYVTHWNWNSAINKRWMFRRLNAWMHHSRHRLCMQHFHSTLCATWKSYFILFSAKFANIDENRKEHLFSRKLKSNAVGLFALNLFAEIIINHKMCEKANTSEAARSNVQANKQNWCFSAERLQFIVVIFIHSLLYVFFASPAETIVRFFAFLFSSFVSFGNQKLRAERIWQESTWNWPLKYPFYINLVRAYKVSPVLPTLLMWL